MSARSSLESRLAQAAALIEPVLERVLPRERDLFISEAVWYHMRTGGKHIRPAICLLTCGQFGGEVGSALNFAAAVEILHNVLLIHDDLEDGDTMRRDQQTVWARFGAGNAINVGDYMLAVALKTIMDSPVSDAKRVRLARVFSDAFQDTCRGQALDINWRGIASIVVDDYLKLVTLKTGRYMALGMVGGGIIADADEGVIELLGELGQRMGAAFQIRDDTIDLTFGKGRGGVTGNDIREGKSSILYAHAICAADAAQKRELIRIMVKPRAETDDADVEKVRSLYRELGSMEFAERKARALVEDAFQIIERLPPSNREFFREITDYMVSRSK